MSRTIILLSIAWLLVSGCDSNDTESKTGSGIEPEMGAAQQRLVSVYLEMAPNNGFIPTYNERLILAEPVTQVPSIRARAEVQVQNTDVTLIGDNCEKLRLDYPDLANCIEEEFVEFEYGETESTATTDSEGFAAMHLGAHEKYRLTVQSFPTNEDEKCHWGGSGILDSTDTTLGIQVVVFCESVAPATGGQTR